MATLGRRVEDGCGKAGMAWWVVALRVKQRCGAVGQARHGAVGEVGSGMSWQAGQVVAERV
jgi:hypothetical protein